MFSPAHNRRLLITTRQTVAHRRCVACGVCFRGTTQYRRKSARPTDQAREKTVAAQPVVLKALAKLAFDFAFSSRRAENADDLLGILLSGITDLDFTHDNPMWRYFELTPDQREATLLGLGAYLATTDGSTNRDIGGFQGGFMRFGAKHSDIYPILGDMIRWKFALPSRHALAG